MSSAFCDGDESITFGAYGFNRAYQWYGSYYNNNYAGEVIEGATDKNFKPNEYKQYPYYYYCQMISTDIDNDGKIVNSFIVNSTLCQNRFYYMYAKDKTEIDFDNKLIFTTQFTQNDFSSIIGTQNTVTIDSIASCSNLSTKLYGTGSMFIVYENSAVTEIYTLIVQGDINGDSAVNVIDLTEIERASNGHNELEYSYFLAGDMNRDEIIDISDFQTAVNMALQI